MTPLSWRESLVSGTLLLSVFLAVVWLFQRWGLS